ncbi:uncharacterized protein L201_000473 [Kwoniella dendrophila CBS 6074]|uniref:Uncharacterized protein n=1 Tax=Kwoniella dendrophila CBS 6074 TaxID=1295534 RepID=A0AAX4JL71_9TREE
MSKSTTTQPPGSMEIASLISLKHATAYLGEYDHTQSRCKLTYQDMNGIKTFYCHSFAEDHMTDLEGTNLIEREEKPLLYLYKVLTEPNNLKVNKQSLELEDAIIELPFTNGIEQTTQELNCNATLFGFRAHDKHSELECHRVPTSISLTNDSDDSGIKLSDLWTNDSHHKDIKLVIKDTDKATITGHAMNPLASYYTPDSLTVFGVHVKSEKAWKEDIARDPESPGSVAALATRLSKMTGSTSIKTMSRGSSQQASLVAGSVENTDDPIEPYPRGYKCCCSTI